MRTSTMMAEKKINVRFVAAAAVFLCVFFACGLTFAQDEGGLYFAGKAGYGFIDGDLSMSHNQTAPPTDEKDSWSNGNFVYGGAIGWNWMDSGLPVRTEIEYFDHGSVGMDYSDSNASFSTSADIQTMQLNFFYDFYTDTKFIPYVGAGVGVANLSGTNCESTTNFAYSLFGGTGYKLTDSLLLDLAYRINQYGDLNVGWSDTDNAYNGKLKNLYSIEAVLGFRLQF